MEDNDNVIEVDFPEAEEEKKERLDPDKVFKIATILCLALNAFNIYLYFTLIKT